MSTQPVPQLNLPDGKPISCMTWPELRLHIAQELARYSNRWMDAGTQQLFRPDGRAIPNLDGQELPTKFFGNIGSYNIYPCISDGYPTLCAGQTGYPGGYRK